MDNQSKLEEPLVNARSEVWRMKISTNLKCLLLYYTMLLCHCAMLKNKNKKKNNGYVYK